MIDPRTDNWAGHRDSLSNPGMHRFPRSAREAGFYYGPEVKERTWPLYLFVAILVGVMYWLG